MKCLKCYNELKKEEIKKVTPLGKNLFFLFESGNYCIFESWYGSIVFAEGTVILEEKIKGDKA